MKNIICKIVIAAGFIIGLTSCKEEKWPDLPLSQTQVYVITPESGDVYQYSLYYNQNMLLVWSESEIVESSNSIKEFVDRSAATTAEEDILYDFEFIENTKQDDVVTEYKYEVKEQAENIDVVDVTITNLTDSSVTTINGATIEKLIKNI